MERQVTILDGLTPQQCAAATQMGDDIPDRNRVTGWLRGPGCKPGRVTAIFDDRLDAAELLRRF